MELIKCRNCGREFMARTNQEYLLGHVSMSAVMVQEAAGKAKVTGPKHRKVKEKPREHTVDNTCPKDCRFRDLLSGTTAYCNYGDIALREGLAARPARGGSVKDCTVYEPGKKKRRTVQIAATGPERRKENEIIAYRRDCIGQRKGG